MFALVSRILNNNSFLISFPFSLRGVCVSGRLRLRDVDPSLRARALGLLLVGLQPVRLRRDHRVALRGLLGQPATEGRVVWTLGSEGAQTA
jgi:hypothetical protein